MEDAANPWSPSSAYIQVGSLQNILVFAEKSGHIDKVSFSWFLRSHTVKIYLFFLILFLQLLVSMWFRPCELHSSSRNLFVNLSLSSSLLALKYSKLEGF